MTRIRLRFQFFGALMAIGLTASVALSATSFSNSLTGFTGNSTQVATRTALMAAGFNVADTEAIPKVIFETSGAKFGDGEPNNDGRNYIRTNDADYANVSFVAEITMVAPIIDSQDGYFGMGGGDPGAFRTPDWTLPNSSVMYWGETEIAEPSIDTFVVDNGDGPFVTTSAPGLTEGTHRIRMTYDWFQKSVVLSFDFNYAGGEFTNDLTVPALDVRPLYGGNGWPIEPARLFFGGDEGIVFKDFQVNVTSDPIVYGDFNGNGTITSADWVILRNNLYKDVGGTPSQAYFLGDLTGDLANNHDDFVAFKSLYEAANGAGAFNAMVASLPEPSALALAIALLPVLCTLRHKVHCATR
jgi:hypothetical protein